jgi:N-acetylmuramoyl-L-alanine amidase
MRSAASWWRCRGDVPVHLAVAFVAVVSYLLCAPAWASTAPVGDPACQRAQFRVVLDVGHTVEVPGAISARGVPEYEFNLNLGNRIERTMIEAGFERTVLLVTAGAAIPSLHQRVARANALHADLFVSIHHDSVPEAFLKMWEHAGNQLRFSDRFRGHSIFVSYENRDFAGSLLFARLLGRQLQARGLQYTPHYTRPDMGPRRRALLDADVGVYRFDRLIVLRSTEMPAVLLEAASIIHREEELVAASPGRQALVSAAVTEAVEEFCAKRMSAAARQAGRPAVQAAPQHARDTTPARADRHGEK